MSSALDIFLICLLCVNACIENDFCNRNGFFNAYIQYKLYIGTSETKCCPIHEAGSNFDPIVFVWHVNHYSATLICAHKSNLLFLLYGTSLHFSTYSSAYLQMIQSQFCFSTIGLKLSYLYSSSFFWQY